MPIPKTTLQQLYLVEKQSMYNIAHRLGCSIHKVEYWLEKYDIGRRNRGDANYAKYNPNGDPFTIKTNLSSEEQNLYYLSMGLYWGEGNKVTKEGLRLGNSDPTLILNWCAFLRRVCQVRESKIHFHLQTFRDNNIATAKMYWAKQLSIDPTRITTGKPTHPLGKGTYTKISPNGVMTVGVYNTHFRSWMMEQLTKLGYNPDKR